ncbi:MAG: hypothetical protein ACM31C_35165 [Acidobacteriota bacterium]
MSLAGIASMTSAFERGDLDEAARQGALAGPVVVERALASATRATQLAAIVAAPAVEDRAELLPALARVAGGPDRRTAIPAARAARTIARELAKQGLPDDLAPGDLDDWRAAFETIARGHDHFVEVRVIALDTASALAHVVDPSALGFDRDAFAKDPDPALRTEAAALVP